MYWYKVPAKISLDTFLLESEFLYFDDLSVPVDTFFYTFKDSISDNRESGVFEYLNVYHHINTIGEYVNSLGYDIITSFYKFVGVEDSLYASEVLDRSSLAN